MSLIVSKMVSQKDIKLIFKKKLNIIVHNEDIEEIKYSYATEVFNIKNKYILRINKTLSENSFEKGYFLLDFFKDKIPCPKVLVFDNSRQLISKCYGVYERIDGDVLQDQWGNYNITTRKQIIKEICEKLLKVLYNTKYNLAFKKYQIDRYNLNPNYSWHDLIYFEILEKLNRIINKKKLSKLKINQIKKYITKNHSILKEENIKLSYWDLHFNNVIVKNKEVVGFIDFDAICYISIDNPLYIIKWQSIKPNDYSNGKSNYNKKNYVNVIKWYKEFCPEMFNFKKLNKRIDLYLLSTYLKRLCHNTYAKEAKKEINKIIKKY